MPFRLLQTHQYLARHKGDNRQNQLFYKFCSLCEPRLIEPNKKPNTKVFGSISLVCEHPLPIVKNKLPEEFSGRRHHNFLQSYPRRVARHSGKTNAEIFSSSATKKKISMNHSLRDNNFHRLITLSKNSYTVAHKNRGILAANRTTLGVNWDLVSHVVWKIIHAESNSIFRIRRQKPPAERSDQAQDELHRKRMLQQALLTSWTGLMATYVCVEP